MRRAAGTWKPSIGLEALAGWLFADLLLVMFIVGLGAEVTSVPEPDPSPTAATATPTPEPTTTPSPTEAVMNQTPVVRTLQVDSADLMASGARGKKAAKALRTQLQQSLSDLADRTAAMVLIWGHAPTVGLGQRIAEEVGGQLPKALPETFGQAAQRTLWKADSRAGEVELEIYLFQRAESGP